MIAFHGKADNSVPYYGGKESDGPRRIVPEPQSVNFWVNTDGVQRDAGHHRRSTDGNVVRDEYGGCRNGTAVVLFTVNDGTHKWYGDKTPWWKFSGHASDAISATDEMWAFFAAHPQASTAAAATR